MPLPQQIFDEVITLHGAVSANHAVSVRVWAEHETTSRPGMPQPTVLALPIECSDCSQHHMIFMSLIWTGGARPAVSLNQSSLRLTNNTFALFNYILLKSGFNNISISFQSHPSLQCSTQCYIVRVPVWTVFRMAGDRLEAHTVTGYIVARRSETKRLPDRVFSS